MSFGIRHVRFSLHRADIAEPTPSARPTDTEGQSQPKQPFYADAESDYYPEDSYIAVTESDPLDTKESFWDEQVPFEDYSEDNADSFKYDKVAFKSKSFKGNYTKSVGKNGTQKISLSDNENIFITKEGEAWYVNEQPDGSVSKMQVQLDGYTGDINLIGGGYYGKSESSQGPQRIPMSDDEDIYLTDEGEAWYVSEQPDGETVKVQLQPE